MIRLIKRFLGLFRPPDDIQVAALCLRGTGRETEVLLIRTLDSGSWILPKGWPMKGKSLAQAAATEAWEEAGLHGVVEPAALGTYPNIKITGKGLEKPCRVHVFVMQVTSEDTDYPEAAFRRKKWLSVEKSLARLVQPELRSIVARYLESKGVSVASVVKSCETR
jgi:8-oxo-dGTP pyrophosphatase MutT (NUDIX family)